MADELDQLTARVNPPARFASCMPDLKYREMTFAMNEIDQDAWKANGSKDDPSPTKIIQQAFGVVTDGDRYFALYNKEMGQLDFISFDPTRAVSKLDQPPRYHWGSMLGTRIQAIPYAYGWAASGNERGVKWSGGGSTLVLTESQRWNNKKDGTVRAHRSCGYDRARSSVRLHG